MIYCFDIDGVICKIRGADYAFYQPDFMVINRINLLYKAGHIIKLFTSRGAKSGQDWQSETIAQLEQWGVKYHELIMGKPDYDVLVDDKAMSPTDVCRQSRIVMLVGAKGVGKTTVRKEFGKLGFCPIFNETKYLEFGSLYPNVNINESEHFQDCIYKDITREIIITASRQNVVYEATGTNPRWVVLHDLLKGLHNVIVIKVTSSLANERLKLRDFTQNYAYTENHLEAISAKAFNIPCDYIIDNSGDIEKLQKRVEEIIYDYSSR